MSYTERAVAPDDQKRDDAVWRFITHGWLRKNKGLPIPSKEEKHERDTDNLQRRRRR
jgi:hypothetical protein